VLARALRKVNNPFRRVASLFVSPTAQQPRSFGIPYPILFYSTLFYIVPLNMLRRL
jgi:hypothetical protein